MEFKPFRTLDSTSRLGGIRIDDMVFLIGGWVLSWVVLESTVLLCLLPFSYLFYYKFLRDKPSGFAIRWIYWSLPVWASKLNKLPSSFKRNLRN